MTSARLGSWGPRAVMWTGSWVDGPRRIRGRGWAVLGASEVGGRWGVVSGRSSAHPGPWVGGPGGRHVDGVVGGRSSAHLWAEVGGGRHVDGVVVGGPRRTRGVGWGKKRVRAPARVHLWLVLIPSLRP